MRASAARSSGRTWMKWEVRQQALQAPQGTSAGASSASAACRLRSQAPKGTSGSGGAGGRYGAARTARAARLTLSRARARPGEGAALAGGPAADLTRLRAQLVVDRHGDHEAAGRGDEAHLPHAALPRTASAASA